MRRFAPIRHIVRLVSCASLALLFAACATTTTSSGPQPREQFVVLKPTVAKDAYKAPELLVHYDSATRALSAFPGGLLPFAIGASIDHARTQSAKNGFARELDGRLEDAEEHLVISISERSEELITQSIKDIGRSASDEQTASKLHSNVTHFGLFLSSKSDDGTPIMGASIAIEFEIERADGTQKRIAPIYSYSRNSYRVDQYEQSPELLTKVIDEAIENMRERASETLRRHTR